MTSLEDTPEEINDVKTSVDVELGYLETVEPAALESHFFPSKVGGKPAWLSFKPLPAIDRLKCGVCNQPMSFLLQVYAPIFDQPSAFHRSIFVFVCRNGECSDLNSARNFTVLRCQLPRRNEFYGENAIQLPSENDNDDDEKEIRSINNDLEIKKVEDFSKICAVCGCLGDKQCAKCKRITYCDRSHQVIHWKNGHKEECAAVQENGHSTKTVVNLKDNNPVLFPEYELQIETEVCEETKPKSERSDEERMREFQQYVQSQGAGEAKNGTTLEKYDDVDNFAPVKKSDKVFKQFIRRVEQNPEQILRYQRRGRPLWAAVSPVPGTRMANGDSADPDPSLDDACLPPCPICGSPRSFEFQIMPHLLSYLDVDNLGKSLDWATVAVYTCDQSCDIPENGYAVEFAWKQDFSQ